MAMRPDFATEEYSDLQAPPPGRRNWFWEVISQSFQAKVGLAVLLAFTAIAFLAPWIEPLRRAHTRRAHLRASVMAPPVGP